MGGPLVGQAPRLPAEAELNRPLPPPSQPAAWLPHPAAACRSSQNPLRLTSTSPRPLPQVAATRDLRAMVNWPGLLELLEEEGVESVPTDGVRYWLARMGGDFQASTLASWPCKGGGRHAAAALQLCRMLLGQVRVHGTLAMAARSVLHW